MHIDLKKAQEPPGMSEMSISHPILFDTSWKTLLSYLLKKFEIHVAIFELTLISIMKGRLARDMFVLDS